MDKPKIAIIADIRNWSFDILADLFKKELSCKYDFKVIYSSEYNKNLFMVLEEVKECDIIHFLCRQTLKQYSDKQFKDDIINNGYDYQEYVNSIKPKISFTVFDHLYIEDKDNSGYLNMINNFTKSYVVCSEKLLKIYSEKNCLKPYGKILDTYDSEKFYPVNIERLEYKNIKNRDLVIGWSGNSNWNIKHGNIDYKGLHTILNPVLDELIAEGYKIKKHYADRNERWIENSKMTEEYYKYIDIYICTSKIEGTPRPILEAMACGIPIISTNVGLVPEVLGEQQKEYIIGERIKQEDDEQVKKNLRNKIIELYNNREKLKELSKENYEIAKMYDSKKIMKQYDKYFSEFVSL